MYCLHLTACSGDKYCMASACICKLESILLFSGKMNLVYGSKFLRGKIQVNKVIKSHSSVIAIKSNDAF